MGSTPEAAARHRAAIFDVDELHRAVVTERVELVGPSPTFRRVWASLGLRHALPRADATGR